MIILPRQARDKHKGGNSKKRRFSQVWDHGQTVYPGAVHQDDVTESMRRHKRWHVPAKMWEDWGDDLQDTDSARL